MGEQSWNDRVEAKARELYEASRKRVSGRPRWEKLNALDAYDMGMRDHAIRLAAQELAWEEYEAAGASHV